MYAQDVRCMSACMPANVSHTAPDRPPTAKTKLASKCLNVVEQRDHDHKEPADLDSPQILCIRFEFGEELEVVLLAALTRTRSHLFQIFF